MEMLVQQLLNHEQSIKHRICAVSSRRSQATNLESVRMLKSIPTNSASKKLPLILANDTRSVSALSELAIEPELTN